MSQPTALQRFSWLVHEVNGRQVVGMPGVRDPENPCEAFQPGKPGGTCETDGHYICDECTERATCADCGNRPMYCECDGGQMAEYRHPLKKVRIGCPLEDLTRANARELREEIAKRQAAIERWTGHVEVGDLHDEVRWLEARLVELGGEPSC